MSRTGQTFSMGQTPHTHSYLPALQYRRGTRLHAACGSFSTFCGKKRDSNCRGTRCPCMTVLPSTCPAMQWRRNDTRNFGPIVLLNPSTAENIRSFAYAARPRNTIGNLVVNRRSLCDCHLRVRCSEATADEFYSTACGEWEAAPLPAVTDAAVVSLRTLLRALQYPEPAII